MDNQSNNQRTSTHRNDHQNGCPIDYQNVDDQQNYLNDHLISRSNNRQLRRQLSSHSSYEHQYQNIIDFQNSDAYQVPISPGTAHLKRVQFGQQTSRSFPAQNCPIKCNVNTNGNNLRAAFQPTLALHKINNRINSHPLAPKDESTSNRTNQPFYSSKSSFNTNLPRFCRTQSTTSAISVQSVTSASLANSTVNSGQPNDVNDSPYVAKRRHTITPKNSVVRSNLANYSNTPPLPIATNSTLSKKLSTQASLTYSTQSFKSAYLAPFQSENYFELNGIESVTSSSCLHGFILIAVILLSITAFVLSKFRDACEDYFYHRAHCYQTSQWFFSSMLLIISLYAFIVYFLHLIGQCDYLNLMAKRKVFTEILVTCLIIFCLLLSSILLIVTTVAMYNYINTVSVVIALVVCILYKIRIYLLYREYRMLNDKPVESVELDENFNQLNDDLNQQMSQQMNHQINNQINSQINNQINGQINSQISNQTNQPQGNNQRFSLQSNQRINQLKDDEFDDDVFG